MGTRLHHVATRRFEKADISPAAAAPPVCPRGRPAAVECTLVLEAAIVVDGNPRFFKSVTVERRGAVRKVVVFRAEAASNEVECPVPRGVLVVLPLRPRVLCRQLMRHIGARGRKHNCHLKPIVIITDAPGPLYHVLLVAVARVERR